MEIFFAVNDKYAQHLCVAMVSIVKNNSLESNNFHIMTDGFSQTSKDKISKSLNKFRNCSIEYIIVHDKRLNELKLNINYISIQTYYRYLIPELFPNLDKAIYLDADLIINADLYSLWHKDIDNFYLAGVKDKYIEKVNYAKKLGFDKEDLYINAGVLLLNLKRMREDSITNKLIANTQKYADIIEYQDQDILNITCKNQIMELEERYNFTSDNVKNYSLKEISQINPVIFHYTGQAKPWDFGCKNKLKNLYFKYLRLTDYKNFIFRHHIRLFLKSIYNKSKNNNCTRTQVLGIKLPVKKINKKIKVGLLIDEFFGGAQTAFGGYGFLARKYIAKYIPNKNIQIDVLLGKSENRYLSEKFYEDDVTLYKLPRKKFWARRWLKKQNYDIYLSIELTSDFVLKNETNPNKKLILWIQDPRPQYEWDEISTVKLFPEKSYYSQSIYDLVHNWHKNNRVKFISQGYFLNPKAKDLYQLPNDVSIQYLPNPVDIDENFDVKTYQKKNKIIFLGRIESVKRGWIFCEIAKRMPEYEFYVLGQTFREKEKNASVMKDYQNILNLHFTGHLDGKEKEQYLKDAKILVNTSIHEALPISFLEALAYGTLIVSNRNPENLTEKFGIWVGDVLGDGFDKVDLYVDAIQKLINDDVKRQDISEQAVNYIKEIHNTSRFIKDLHDIIQKELDKK